MGGPDKVKRQHDGGKLTVRERIDALLDPGSFHEIGALAGRAQYARERRDRVVRSRPISCSGAAGSTARPVVVGGDDFTVRGGAADASIRGKQVQSEQMANELRMPIVRLVDGTGGGGSVKTLETHGLHLRAGQSRLGLGGRQHGRRCRSWRWRSARSRGSARRGSSPATTR